MHQLATTHPVLRTLVLVLLALAPATLFATEAAPPLEAATLDLTATWVGYWALIIFVIAYALVMGEEFTHLRKSKPVMLAAGVIWAMVAYYYATTAGNLHSAEEAVHHNIMEFAELFLFLLAAMTYINAMEERLVFDALRAWLIRRRFSYRTLFWITGILAFLISPVADNLTTALLMCAVVMAVGADKPAFIGIACINIVVAANAGGAFSPFGDITTLMVWQKGIVSFGSFFLLLIPAVVNFAVPAWFMQRAVPDSAPPPVDERVRMKRGAWVIVFLFLCTIGTAVSFHNFLGLPPVLGMMTGLAYLKIFGYILMKMGERTTATYLLPTGETGTVKYQLPNGEVGTVRGEIEDTMPFDIYNKLARAEWDTLMFFYGVILCVGGLGFIGYLELVSQFSYGTIGPLFANSMVGILSAIVDNIPVMFAVLTMNPDMSLGHWLLVTLTAGVGGSMLSIGSAAGVALMGQSKGMYTFFTHLRWTPYILLGYGASIIAHLIVNFWTFAIPAAG